jgi:drug/metabolite transporter (DMT)-like permease
MHFVLLKVLSSAGLGAVLKRVDAAGLERLPVIRMNYAMAAVLAFLAALATRNTYIAQRTVLLAVATGGLFVAGILVWAGTIRAAGLARSVVALRTAVVIPLLTAVLLWHERPTLPQLAGSGVALAALGLVLSEVARPAAGTAVARSAPFWLVGLFLVDGPVMASAQVFARSVPREQVLPFQAVIFITGFAIASLIYFARRAKTTPTAFSWGALLGTANLGNYLFLVLALTLLPGVVVYPVIAAAEVGLMALAGAVIWHEKVGPRAWVGIGLAVVALVLIQLSKPPAP